MLDYIDDVASDLQRGLPTEEIHRKLKEVGLSNAQAYYTFIAGRMIYEDRKRAFEREDTRRRLPTYKEMKAVKIQWKP
jgi:hypothetical protein